jgi:hypothetical protein
VVELSEIERYRQRAESKLSESASPLARRLLLAYRALEPRFRADLAEPRDVALSCAGALMLAQALLREGL